MGIPTKLDLQKYYSSGKSMFQTSKILNYSPSKVVYWMKKYNIKRRSRSDATYLSSNPDGDPFDLKDINKLSNKKRFLHGLGIGLYWGEGEKTTKHSIRVANSDPFLIIKFREFLIKICKLKVEKIGYSLICFNDINPEVAKNYWVNLLKISPDKFGKITEIPMQGKGTYKKKSQYGVCILYAGNIKLKNWIMSEIKKYNIA
jgi:hypothetical protein